MCGERAVPRVGVLLQASVSRLDTEARHRQSLCVARGLFPLQIGPRRRQQQPALRGCVPAHSVSMFDDRHLIVAQPTIELPLLRRSLYLRLKHLTLELFAL